MGKFTVKKLNSFLLFSVCILFTTVFLFKDLLSVKSSYAAELALPAPSQLISSSCNFVPMSLVGIKLNTENLLNLEFIIDLGDQKKIDDMQLKRLINYFFTSLTVFEEDLWVNLSPYEADRVLASGLEKTDLGKDLLAQDYVLKQFSSSLTEPNSQLGRAYWALQDSEQSANNAIDKIWISPESALIKENANIAIIDSMSLKVEGETEDKPLELLYPQIKSEVNSGRHFHQLRQMCNSILLATWFKAKLKDTLWKNYLNQNKLKGVDTIDPLMKDKIYSLYCDSFKEGVYSIIKKTKSQEANITQKRKYFSGGLLPQFENKVQSSAITEADITKLSKRHKKLYISNISARAIQESSSAIDIEAFRKELKIKANETPIEYWKRVLSYTKLQLDPFVEQIKAAAKSFDSKANITIDEIDALESLVYSVEESVSFLMSEIQKAESAASNHNHSILLDALMGLVADRYNNLLQVAVGVSSNMQINYNSESSEFATNCEYILKTIDKIGDEIDSAINIKLIRTNPKERRIDDGLKSSTIYGPFDMEMISFKGDIAEIGTSSAIDLETFRKELDIKANETPIEYWKRFVGMLEGMYSENIAELKELTENINFENYKEHKAILATKLDDFDRLYENTRLVVKQTREELLKKNADNIKFIHHDLLLGLLLNGFYARYGNFLETLQNCNSLLQMYSSNKDKFDSANTFESIFDEIARDIKTVKSMNAIKMVEVRMGTRLSYEVDTGLAEVAGYGPFILEMTSFDEELVSSSSLPVGGIDLEGFKDFKTNVISSATSNIDLELGPLDGMTYKVNFTKKINCKEQVNEIFDMV